jgi:hypothetical protein
MGRRRRDTTIFLKKNSIKDSVRSEDNGYPAPDINKTMTSVTKEPNDAHKTPSERKS